MEIFMILCISCFTKKRISR